MDSQETSAGIFRRLGIDIDGLRTDATDPATHKWSEQQVLDRLVPLVQFDSKAQRAGIVRLCKDALKTSDRAQRPNFLQRDLFEGDKILPLGGLDRVRVKHASLQQVAEWWALVMRNSTAQAEAHMRAASARALWLLGWSRHPNALSLGDVARLELWRTDAKESKAA